MDGSLVRSGIETSGMDRPRSGAGPVPGRSAAHRYPDYSIAERAPSPLGDAPEPSSAAFGRGPLRARPQPAQDVGHADHRAGVGIEEGAPDQLDVVGVD